MAYAERLPYPSVAAFLRVRAGLFRVFAPVITACSRRSFPRVRAGHYCVFAPVFSACSRRSLLR
ncbi:hypothetical protein, partial [Streptomyces tauricus]|uniref:hypothetical protein n=1 Tax=Streptomyces tauricus TaxID=68274 RepID=UPI003417EEDD